MAWAHPSRVSCCFDDGISYKEQDLLLCSCLWSRQAKKFLSCGWLHHLARCYKKNKSKNDKPMSTEKHTSKFEWLKTDFVFNSCKRQCSTRLPLQPVSMKGRVIKHEQYQLKASHLSQKPAGICDPGVMAIYHLLRHTTVWGLWGISCKRLCWSLSLFHLEICIQVTLVSCNALLVAPYQRGGIYVVPEGDLLNWIIPYGFQAYCQLWMIIK